jgi:hypothetical protein
MRQQIWPGVLSSGTRPDVGVPVSREIRRTSHGASCQLLGTFRTWVHVRLESVVRTKADVCRPLQVHKITPKRIVLWSAVGHDFGRSKPHALPGTIPNLPGEGCQRSSKGLFPRVRCE